MTRTDEQATVPDPSAEAAMAALLSPRDLGASEAKTLFAALVDGCLDGAQISALLVALRLKGESAEELAGAAAALREAAVEFPRPDYLFADSCGTGGDGSCSINVSTAAAFVAAAAGLPVAKHGNRSFSSKCGSADVLELLGANLELDPAQSRKILDETGFCFLFAPAYHPGLKHAGPVRRKLKVRTIMNLLGPCLNPARPPVQLLGVADPSLLDKVAETLKSLGVERALVVHGSGLDEVAVHGPTEAILLQGTRLERLTIDPKEAGLHRGSTQASRSLEPKDNADRLRALLDGKAHEGDSEVVSINAGALLMTAGVAKTIAEGTAIAAEKIGSGAAGRVLDAYIEASNG